MVDDDGWVDDEVALAGDCPRCGASDVRPILYGYPMFDDVERLAGRVQFAGCLVPSEPRRFACGVCRTEWGSRVRGGEPA